MIILPWTPKICLECLLCFNQSQARSSHHRNHKQRTVSYRSRNKLFSFCSKKKAVLSSLILANIFLYNKGIGFTWANDWTFNLPSYVPAEVPWSQDRKLERPPIKFNICGMIDTSRKVISLIFRFSFQNIILLFLWRHLCIWCLGDYMLQ